MGIFGFVKKIGKKIGGAAKKVGGVAIKAGTIAANLGTGGIAGTVAAQLGGLLFDREQSNVDEALAELQAAAGLNLSGDVLGLAGVLPYIRQNPPPADGAGNGTTRADWLNGAAIAVNLYEPENAIGQFKFDALDVFKRYVQVFEERNGLGPVLSSFIDSTSPGNGNRPQSFAQTLQATGATSLREMDARLFGRTLPGFNAGAADVTNPLTGARVEGPDFVDRAQSVLDAFAEARRGPQPLEADPPGGALSVLGATNPTTLILIAVAIVVIFLIARK